MSDELAVYVRSTMSYNFEVQYVPGRKNQLADYLSRHPAWKDNDEGQDDGDPPFAVHSVDLECDTLAKTREDMDFRLRSNWLFSEIIDAAIFRC